MKRKTIIKLLSGCIFVAVLLLAMVLKYNYDHRQVLITMASEEIDNSEGILAIRTENSNSPGTYVTSNYKDLSYSTYYFDADKSYCVRGGTVVIDKTNPSSPVLKVHARGNDKCFAYFSLLSRAPLGMRVVLDNGGEATILAKTSPDFSTPVPLVSYVDTITAASATSSFGSSTYRNKYVTYSTVAPTFSTTTGKYSFNQSDLHTTTLGDFHESNYGTVSTPLYLVNLTPADTNATPTYTNLNNAYRVIRLSGSSTITIRHDDHEGVSSTSGGASGMYAALDDYGTSYYFRGAVTNNYVDFANYTWRIIRVNGDGTVKIILDTAADGAGAGAYNNVTPYNNERVGYVYTIGQSHGTTTGSSAKGMLEEWYLGNISGGYRDYLADTKFCNDRSVSEGVATGIAEATFNGYNRVTGVNDPTLICPHTGDLLSKADGHLGRNVGMITADELIMGGLIASSTTWQVASSDNYLDLGNPYWTMTPSTSGGSSSSDMVYMITSDSVQVPVSNTTYYRVPVVNIKADVYASGSGTSANPYLID